jgi:pimeloyl-ACP methyl ester carboxylesterase
MTRHLYALLVAIDQYAAPVSPLNGCVNDVLAIKTYLEERVKEPSNLHIQTLLNQESTYAGIISAFRSHLGQAKAGDAVLFYYAGHGSQEQTPAEFWAIEPDHWHETLVCYDSRTPTGKDLADKELAKLIAEVAEHKPQMTIVLDCCHSGSGTRDIDPTVAVRQAPADSRVRSIDQFLFSASEIEQLSSTENWKMPHGNHVLISACRDRELAKELRINGQSRGAFSYYLQDTLRQANGSLTVRELFKRTHALVSNRVTAQSPQLESSIADELDQPFMGGAIAPRSPYFTVSYHKEDEWIIDAGAVHGIPQPSVGETMTLALFPLNASADELKTRSGAIATAQVLEVLPQRSKVKITGISSLEPEQVFKAIATSLPLPPKGIALVGDTIGLELARNALSTSLYIRAVETVEDAEFKLIAKDQQYWITRSTDERPIVNSISGYTAESASRAIERLEHMSRWLNIVELSSLATSRIRPDAVQMQIYQDGQEIQDLEIRLSYRQEGQTLKQPSCKIKLKNTSDETLYCALLDLTDRFAVNARLLEAGGIWLDPGEEVWALGNQPIYPTVPEKLWKQGITETRDILKLIVATTEFDATLLEQPELDLPTLPSRSVSRGRGTLNRLMNRVQHRDLKATSEEDLYDDWVTSQILITTVRPQPTVPIANRDGALGSGVTILAHPSLTAQARLTSEMESTRSIGNVSPPLLQQVDSQPFQFVASRGSDPGLSVLEISQITDRSQVTAAAPLKLLVDTPLASNEGLLAIAHDGEFLLPLGNGQTVADGKTEITLTRLPDAQSDELESRSLGGAVKIFFRKVVMESFGLEYDYPQLAIAQVHADDTVIYIKDREAVKSRIAQSRRLVLYIHGIIGDTRSMVPSLQRAKLGDRYDTILTFDYENLNTPIEENARLLKQKLAEVGLGDDHGKMLHIVAHSMGGLVSRWMIEKEGGDRVVQHLMMFGTPNGGSPWATLQDWASATLSLGLNGLSKVTWSAPVVEMLVNCTRQSIDYSGVIQVSLDQMRPGSKFLQALADSADTGVPYTIVAGNTSIISAAFHKEQNQQFSPLEKLMKKLFNGLVEIPFFEQSNDIAATVRSIKSVSWVSESQVYEIGCDHLVYFSDPIGLEAFSKAQAQGRSVVMGRS